MAEFKQIYKPDGSYEEHLSFAGKEFISRRAPFRGCISRGMDPDISDQVEAALPNLPNLEEICSKIEDLTTGFEDGQDVIPWLTTVEKEMNRDV